MSLREDNSGDSDSVDNNTGCIPPLFFDANMLCILPYAVAVALLTVKDE